jgi:hypothetical protein
VRPHIIGGSGTCASAAANEPGGPASGAGTSLRGKFFISGPLLSHILSGRGSSVLLFASGEKALIGMHMG